MAKKATIYRRYSSKEQGGGHSLERQRNTCEMLCQNAGYEIVEWIEDEGESAWTGANITTGNMAKLVDRFEREGGDGKVIVVEYLDRLSRRPATEILVFMSRICATGASIAASNLFGVIDAYRLERDAGLLHQLVSDGQRGFEESQIKSDRVGKAWAAKRELGKPMTKRTVAWVSLDKVEGEFSVIEERANLVRRIFKLALTMGAGAIAKQFNEEEVPTFGRSKGWQVSYIKKILKNRAVLGEYQPHTKPKGGKRTPSGDLIPDYYPQIITEADFAAAQRTSATLKRSVRAGVKNVLSGLCKCSECGSSVIRINSGTETLANGGKVAREYLQCEASRRGLCENKTRHSYPVVFKQVCDGVLAQGLRSIETSNPHKEQQLAKAERTIEDLKVKRDRLLALVEDGDEHAVGRYRELGLEINQAERVAKEAREELAAASVAPDVSELLADLERGGDTEDSRLLMKRALERFVKRIVFKREKLDFNIVLDVKLFQLGPITPFRGGVYQLSREAAKKLGIKSVLETEEQQWQSRASLFASS